MDLDRFVCYNLKIPISAFKDEYLLDFINVEELGVRDKSDVDEKTIENAIIHNVKNFILTFGKDFAFVRNHLVITNYYYTFFVMRTGSFLTIT